MMLHARLEQLADEMETRAEEEGVGSDYFGWAVTLREATRMLARLAVEHARQS